MFIMTQDLNTIINTDHVVKFATNETVAPTITATLDTGEVIILGKYFPEDTMYKDRKFAEIFEKLTHKDKGVFINPYTSDKPGEFVGKGDKA